MDSKYRYVGKRVSTKFGEGEIIDIDLPESDRAWRLVVKIDVPNKLCCPTPAFFLNELTFLK